MRSTRVGALALAAGVSMAACAPAAVTSPLPAERVPGLVVRDGVAGVPAEVLHPKPSVRSDARIIMRPLDSRPNARPPLVFVDGRVLKHPESLDPSRIGKLHLLKNPVATKRYGMRAAGGAVLISTRR